MEDVLVFTGINILLAWSFYLILMTGQISLGNGAFMAAGAYISSLLTLKADWPFPLVLVAALLIVGVIGAVVGFPALRTRGVYLLMLTLGIAAATEVLLRNIDYIGGPQGLFGMQGASLGIVYLVVFLVLLFMIQLTRSPMFQLFDAIREDETAANALGVNTTYLKVISFGLGAAVASVAGVLYAHYLLFIQPDDFGVFASLFLTLYVILGGSDNLWGPIVGAAVMTILPEQFRFLDEWRYEVFGIVIIALIALRPEGLITRSAIRSLRRRFEDYVVPPFKRLGRKVSR